MTKTELIQRLAENHNRVASILVRGDNAVFAGDTIKDLRVLIEQLQNEGIQEEREQCAEAKKA